MLTTKSREERLRQYEQFRPVFREIGRSLPKDRVLIDVGCETGITSLEIAKDLGAQEVVLADMRNELEVKLSNKVRFERVDVCSDNFVRTFLSNGNYVGNVVTCIRALHEFSDPRVAVVNMINILPQGGCLVILDAAEAGWEALYSITSQDSVAAFSHYLEDLKNAARHGLFLDIDIKAFWDEFEMVVPGRLRFTLCGGGQMYAVCYQAFDWGVIKPMPSQLSSQISQERAGLGI